MPELNDEDRARLMSCMDEIRDIVGETCSDRQMVEAIMKHDYSEVSRSKLGFPILTEH